MRYWYWLMARIAVVCTLVTLISHPSSMLAQPSDRFTYVVALEKEHPDEPSTFWNPTLYRISLKQGTIVQSLKLADKGAPISCSPGKKGIRIVLHEGIFSNGTRPGDTSIREIAVNPDTMAVAERQTIRGIDETKVPIEELLKSRQESTLIARTLPDKETFLADCPTISRVLTLSDYSKKESLSVTIRDRSSLREIEAIPLNVGDCKLGGFSGTVDTAFVGDRFLICLFEGESAIGKFAPAYVMIVDIATNIVKWVSIGSDPALGISY